MAYKESKFKVRSDVFEAPDGSIQFVREIVRGKNRDVFMETMTPARRKRRKNLTKQNEGVRL